MGVPKSMYKREKRSARIARLTERLSKLADGERRVPGTRKKGVCSFNIHSGPYLIKSKGGG